MDDEERKMMVIEAEKVIISLGEKIQQIQRDIKEEWITCQKELELIKRENELSKKVFDDSSETLKINEKNLSNTINTFSSTIIETQNQNEARILLITQYLDDIGKEIQKFKIRFDVLDEGLKSNIKLNTQLVESANIIKSDIGTVNNNIKNIYCRFETLVEEFKSINEGTSNLIEITNLIKSNIGTTNSNVREFYKKYIEKSLKYDALFKKLDLSNLNAERKIKTFEKNNKIFFIIIIILLIVNSALILITR